MQHLEYETAPRQHWRAEARAAVRRYPQHRAELEALRAGQRTPGMTRSPETAQVTELQALTLLPEAAQREYEAVRFALLCTVGQNGRDWQDRLKLVRLLYWSPDRLTITGAAMRIPCSAELAKQWNSSFLALVDAGGVFLRGR